MLPALSRRACVALLLCSAPAYADPEAWISGVGDDANPCTRTAPCATLQHAHDVVDDDGTITLLDPAHVGGATLTRPVTVEGAFRGRTLDATGIIIQAPVTSTVVLRNLSLQLEAGTMGVVDGVNVVSAGNVVLEDVVVAAFSGAGVRVSAAMPVRLHVRRGTVMDNAGPGIAVAAGGHALTTTDTFIVRNGSGVTLAEGSRGVIRGGSISGNVGGAVEVSTAGGVETWVHVEDGTVSGNGTGLQADGQGARVHVHRVVAEGNAGGSAVTQNGGQVLSWGTNTVSTPAGFEPVDAGPPPPPDAGQPDSGPPDAGNTGTSSGPMASSDMVVVSSSAPGATSSATSSATSAATSSATSAATSSAASVAMSGTTSAAGSSSSSGGTGSSASAAASQAGTSPGDGSGGDDEDGCACEAQRAADTPWWALVLLAWPVARRRVRRG